MSTLDHTEKGRVSLSLCRSFLNGHVRKVERLISKMDTETQERYRSTSKPHNALAALDRLEALLRTTTVWVETEVQEAQSEAPEGSATETVGRELVAEIEQFLKS